LTPANFDEPEAALALTLSVDGGILLDDLGYRSRADWQGETLAEEADMLLIHPADAGAKTNADGTINAKRALISSVRERVETSFNGLWDRFIDRNFSRSWQGLWSTLKLKMLHFNLCQTGYLPA
jgi:hypothetical protein